jgi:hypothetical protein
MQAIKPLSSSIWNSLKSAGLLRQTRGTRAGLSRFERIRTRPFYSRYKSPLLKINGEVGTTPNLHIDNATTTILSGEQWLSICSTSTLPTTLGIPK